MASQEPGLKYDFNDPLAGTEAGEEASEDDLWFLPGPIAAEPDDLPPGPRAEPAEAAVLDDWRKAEAGQAAPLARVAGRLGAMDDRLMRGPAGWRHRLALIEAADLGWLTGDRVAPDRLALWLSLRLSGVQDDAAALARVGWAVRRLTGGPGPEVDLPAFLDRRDPETLADTAEPFAERAGGWLDLMAPAPDHPRLPGLSPLGPRGPRAERLPAGGGRHRGADRGGRGQGGRLRAPGHGRGSERFGRAAGRRPGCRPSGALARRDGDGLPDRDAAARRYRGLGCAGRGCDVAAFGQDAARLARRADRMAPCLRPDGRGSHRRQPRGRPAQPRLDGSPWPDPRGDGAGAVSDVACGELTTKVVGNGKRRGQRHEHVGTPASSTDPAGRSHRARLWADIVTFCPGAGTVSLLMDILEAMAARRGAPPARHPERKCGPLPRHWTGLSENFPATMGHSGGAVADEEIEIHRPADRLRAAAGGSGYRGRGICRKMGVSQATFYRWKKVYGGLMPSEVRRLKQLEEENARLRRLVADLSLDKEMLTEVIRKKI